MYLLRIVAPTKHPSRPFTEGTTHGIIRFLIHIEFCKMYLATFLF